MFDAISQLDAAITKVGIPTETLAELSGISRPQISRLLNRRVNSNPDTLTLVDTVKRVEALLGAGDFKGRRG